MKIQRSKTTNFFKEKSKPVLSAFLQAEKMFEKKISFYWPIKNFVQPSLQYGVLAYESTVRTKLEYREMLLKRLVKFISDKTIRIKKDYKTTKKNFFIK